MSAFEVVGSAIRYRLQGRPVQVRRQADLVLLDDGLRQIAIVAEGRAVKYPNGISARQATLARQYRLGSLVKFRAGDLCVNCGANIGEVTMWLARRGARVIAVEPDPTTLVPLRHNVSAWDSVEVVPKGLWSTDGQITFYQKPETADTSAFNQWGEAVSIPVTTLDTLLAGVDGPLQLLVGDAEGAEPEVFEGAIETLKRTRYVSFDVGPERQGTSTKEVCKKVLRDVGFTIIEETRHNKLIALRR